MGRPAFTPRPLSSAQSALVLSLLDWVESGVEKYAKTNDNEQWVVTIGGALKIKNRRRHLKLTGVTA